MTPQRVPDVQPVPWLKKGRLQDLADDRRYKLLAGVALALLVIAWAAYAVVLR